MTVHLNVHKWTLFVQLLLAHQVLGNISIFQDIAEDPKFVVNFTDTFIGDNSMSFFMNPNNDLPGVETDFINGTSNRRIIFRGEEGSRFICNIVSPMVSAELTESKSLSSEELIKVTQNETSAGIDILNSLQGQCLLMQAGWWTYKFCFNGEVSQFHLPTTEEPKSEKGLIVFVLGKHSSSLPISSADEKIQTIEASGAVPNTVVRPTPNKNILVQQWGGGTACSLNNQPRSVEVHYMCIPGQQARIVSIKEPRSCHYLIEINTPKLCHKSFFSEKSKPSVHPIHCAEVVPDDEVEKRTKEAVAKKLAAKKKALSELGSSKSPNYPTVKYIGRFSAKDDQVKIVSVLNDQLRNSKDSSKAFSEKKSEQAGDDEKSPDTPTDDFYGTISKLLTLIKQEVKPEKREESDEDSQEDEL